MTNGDVLNSWKEIATYVGRGVRTVQRWEQELHLPVRRPRGKQRSAVIAIKQDIDAWLRTPHNPSDEDKQSRRAAHHKNHARLINNTKLLISRTNSLLSHSDALQKQIARAVSIGRALRISCQGSRAERQSSASQAPILHEEIDKAITLH